MIKLASDKQIISSSLIFKFYKFFKYIDEIFPVEKPSLLHGDLWNGNYMLAESGIPCLFDPAVYYGHREMDIGMTFLFGGFDSIFYDTYNEVYPMKEKWSERLEYYNLYPLMVHVNLFGTSYISHVEGILKKF